MKELPNRIYRAAQVRELDRLAIEEHEIPGYTLMYRAGEAALNVLRKRWPGARRLLVLCGAGNNAGDGYVIARLAQAERMHVLVAALFDPEKLRGDAHIAWEAFHAAGGQVVEWDPELLETAEVIVDAILGIGLARPLEGRPAEVVDAVNAANKPVLAIDVPTGLSADTGAVLGTAIRAEMTISFVGLKLGLYLAEGPEHTGALVFDDLGVAALVSAGQPYVASRLDPALIGKVLPRRRRSAHKGEYGHVLLVGGGLGMPGAIRLAAEAALHAGAGLVTVATSPPHVPVVLAGRPELMARGVRGPDDLAPLMAAADVVAVGPGLGDTEWGRSLLSAVTAGDALKVLDADALNLLAKSPRKRDDWVLTPHPGEAGRLLGIATAEVQADRLNAVTHLMERYGGIAVLKGAGTLVAHRGEVPSLCDRGNPGMAAPGMGDVLTGVIAGLAAQTGELFDATRVGVLVHALAGDDAARGGERGMLASELFSHIRRWVNAES